MTQPTEIIHVTYGMSRADSVRDALRAQGCEARVIGLLSALNFAPINPPNQVIRQAWIKTVPRCDPDDDPYEPEEPWAEATAAGVHPVCWVCLTDAAEQASFLEFTFRMAGRPFDIVSSGLKDRGRPFMCADADAANAAWKRLRSEDAPLRVVRDGCLVSAPLTHFDASLTVRACAEWEVAAKLVGRTLYYLSTEADPPGQGVSDLVLFDGSDREGTWHSRSPIHPPGNAR